MADYEKHMKTLQEKPLPPIITRLKRDPVCPVPPHMDVSGVRLREVVFSFRSERHGVK